VRVFLVCGKQARFIAAISASHHNGFVPEAYCRAERIALARRKRFAAFYANVFFFGGMLCGYEGGEGKPRKKERNAYYCNCYGEWAHL
jgi:hypothetical protein